MLTLDTAERPHADQPTRTYLMLRPEEREAHRLHQDGERSCQRAGVRARRRPREILHMTLLPIAQGRGRMPDHMLALLDVILRMIRFPAFDVPFDQVQCFHGSGAFVLTNSDGVTDAAALQLAIVKALELHGFRITRHRFTPHMTLAYSHHPEPPAPIPLVRWRARQIQLIESWYGKTTHKRLGYWPLWETAPDIKPNWNWEVGESGAA